MYTLLSSQSTKWYSPRVRKVVLWSRRSGMSSGRHATSNSARWKTSRVWWASPRAHSRTSRAADACPALRTPPTSRTSWAYHARRSSLCLTTSIRSGGVTPPTPAAAEGTKTGPGSTRQPHGRETSHHGCRPTPSAQSRSSSSRQMSPSPRGWPDATPQWPIRDHRRSGQCAQLRAGRKTPPSVLRRSSILPTRPPHRSEHFAECSLTRTPKSAEKLVGCWQNSTFVCPRSSRRSVRG